ncbi:MAG: DUF4071 domain-containing protein [Chloroflexi bacterium]|nr:DUF4071 domain-containing protein [Chloroflexota bacterium]
MAGQTKKTTSVGQNGDAKKTKLAQAQEGNAAVAEEDALESTAVTSAPEKSVPKAQPGNPFDFREEQQEMEEGGLQTRPHAFMVMPFGKKKGFDNQIVDFDAIYQTLLKPALEEAGFEPFRADEETVSGDILTDMFQELLLADLVLVDMSIDNANVFYELGVRHAFRKRGIVHISSGRSYMPFDVFNVRTIPYHTTEDGLPDPNFTDKDKQAIIRVCRDTYSSDIEAIHSPIFNLLTGLDEPNRTTLTTPLATGFWREYNEWKERVTIAQRQKRIGDILLLTEEISNPLIKEEAIGEAGNALRGMERHELALAQYRQGLEINPKNLDFRRQEAFHLNRLERVDEAIVKLENLLHDEPSDTDAIGKLGRIYKDMWMDSWEKIEDQEKRLHEAFNGYHWLLKSIITYLKGYRYDLNQYYPGVNALTLATLLITLADRFDDPEDPDPDISAVRHIMPQLQGTLQFALEALAQDDNSDYWTLASLAELRVLTAEHPRQVTRAYRKALTAARKNMFYLESSLQQLNMLQSLEMRPEFVEAGIQILQAEIDRISHEKYTDEEEALPPPGTEVWSFLFTGHMIDHSGLSFKRFPENLEDEVRKHIHKALDKLEADSNDYAFLAGAACGGEIVFIEECLKRDIRVHIHLPYAEPDYIKRFISFGGDSWVERYYMLRNNSNVEIHFQRDRVGKVKKGDNPYERNNRWSLYSSLILGIDKVRLIALWDGKSGQDQDLDGYLVNHMVNQMRKMGGIVEHLNITKFDYGKPTKSRSSRSKSK